ncbi:outer membrane protein assembly factor BamB family protein [Natronococcus jeotgali]|uniref:Pyrrolo-quinoline quinone n=1 Tax=Natronococcus jeotgali DSM 18795 TaxID=1227498 RepID=L9X4H0_9EURY|nr:PQQ-binding-like beta-propeller repeat protein [Natronococcus jeotgali]ELY56366.1 pyrrolo-quinoline quinone [Natronococcus jeotgali DSM 18795]
MTGWRRRTILGTGAALSIGVVATGASGAAETGDTDASLEESDGWSSYRGNAGNTAYVPSDGSFPKPETVAWEYDEAGRAAIVDGTVYLRTGGAVHALDDADGSVRWESEGVGAGGTPAVAGDAVVVGGDALTVFEADTGKVRWSEPFDGESPVTSPTVADGTAYAVADGTLLAYDLADGSPRWSRDSVSLEASAEGAAADADGREAGFEAIPVAVANGLAYAVADGFGIAAFDAESGDTEWTHWRRDYDGLSVSGVAATAERVYVGGSPEDDFPILDAATGDRIGAGPSVFPPAATDAVQVAASRNGLRVRDYEADGGWEDVGGTSGWRAPAVVGDTVVLPYYPGYNERAVVGLALEDGGERWEFTHAVVDGDALADWYAVTEETIYTNGANGLVALRAEHGDDGESDEADGNDEPTDDDADSGDGESGDSSDGDENATEETGDDETDAESESDTGDDGGNETNDDGTESDDENGTNGDDAAEANEDEFEGEETGSDGEENASESGTNGTNGTDGKNTGDEADGGNGTVDGDGDDGSNGATDTSDDEGMPGFTAGAGVVGGALGLEWLRRRASDESPESTTRD